MTRSLGVVCVLALAGCARGEAMASVAPRLRTPAAESAPSARAPVAANARAIEAPPATEAPRVRRPARTEILRLASAPFAAHPEVLVHTPEGFDPEAPLHVVLFLHGWYGCVPVVAGERNAPCRPRGRARKAIGVVPAFDRAGVNAVLVIPQLAFDRASSNAGQLNEPGGLRRMLDELRATPEAVAMIGPAERRMASFTLAGHSGAHNPLGRLLDAGDVSPQCVLFFDALYLVPPELDRWARANPARFDPRRGDGGTRLLFAFTDGAGTGWNTRRFVRSLAGLLPGEVQGDALAVHGVFTPPPREVYEHTLVAVRTREEHERVPRVFLPPMLRSCAPAIR